MQDRQPQRASTVIDLIEATPIRFVPPTRAQAEIAASARLRFPLNLGDCFAYALAKDEGLPLLTLNRDFRNTDVELILPDGY